MNQTETPEPYPFRTRLADALAFPFHSIAYRVRRYIAGARTGRVRPFATTIWTGALALSAWYAIATVGESLLGLPAIAASAYMIARVDGWHCVNDACGKDAFKIDSPDDDRLSRLPFEDLAIERLEVALRAINTGGEPVNLSLIAEDVSTVLDLLSDVTRKSPESPELSIKKG